MTEKSAKRQTKMQVCFGRIVDAEAKVGEQVEHVNSLYKEAEKAGLDMSVLRQMMLLRDKNRDERERFIDAVITAHALLIDIEGELP